MKKIIFILVAIVAIIVSSCKNDAIDVEYVKVPEPPSPDSLYYDSLKNVANTHSPIDMTSEKIKNSSFDTNEKTGWSISSENGAYPKVNYGCLEFWYTNFSMSQEITRLPQGYYLISVQAYYRYGDCENDYADYKKNKDLNSNALLYAESSGKSFSTPVVREATQLKKAPFGALSGNSTASYAIVNPGADSYGHNDYMANNMACADSMFRDGLYQNKLIAYVGSDHKLTIGIKNSKYFTSDWCIMDNWKIEYYGDTNIPNDVSVETVDYLWDSKNEAEFYGFVNNSKKCDEQGIVYGNNKDLNITNGNVVKAASTSMMYVKIKNVAYSDSLYYRTYVKINGKYIYGSVRQALSDPTMNISVDINNYISDDLWHKSYAYVLDYLNKNTKDYVYEDDNQEYLLCGGDDVFVDYEFVDGILDYYLISFNRKCNLDCYNKYIESLSLNYLNIWFTYDCQNIYEWKSTSNTIVAARNFMDSEDAYLEFLSKDILTSNVKSFKLKTIRSKSIRHQLKYKIIR